MGISHFSFNRPDGQCVRCKGTGCQEELLADKEVYLAPCPACDGLRYTAATLAVRWCGRSIGEVLQLTVSEGREVLKEERLLERKLTFLEQAGLAYLVMGQPSNTLSGGESQRVKISKQLSKRLGDRSLYLLDTPSRGLSVCDVGRLAGVFRALVQKLDAYHAGIVDDDIEIAEFGNGFLDRIANLFLAADVAGDCQGLAAGGIDFGSYVSAHFHASSDQHDLGTLLGEQPCRRRADA